MVRGHCVVTLSLTVNEILKCLSSLPILMKESFWWWQSNHRYIISLFSHLHIPLSPCFPSLISLWFLWTLSTMFIYFFHSEAPQQSLFWFSCFHYWCVVSSYVFLSPVVTRNLLSLKGGRWVFNVRSAGCAYKGVTGAGESLHRCLLRGRKVLKQNKQNNNNNNNNKEDPVHLAA